MRGHSSQTVVSSRHRRKFGTSWLPSLMSGIVAGSLRILELGFLLRFSSPRLVHFLDMTLTVVPGAH